MNDAAIVCTDLCKQYEIYDNEFDRLKGLFSRKVSASTFNALDHINCTFNKGEVIGFVGLNGSGKSTLSRIIAGISTPTSGGMTVNGSVSMLSAGSGMNNLLTGRENITYKCLLLGFSSKDISKIEQKIIDFADIGFYIDQPIRTYSSGMRARLGFAISVHIDPDVLIVDEALAVGDGSFTERCMERMNLFQTQGKTIIFVSHSTSQMDGFCHRIMWLHNGKNIGFGETAMILPAYNQFAKQFNKMNAEQRKDFEPQFESNLS